MRPEVRRREDVLAHAETSPCWSMRYDADRDLHAVSPGAGADFAVARRGLYCRTGLRKAKMTSGVSVTHHGPRGATWTPSSLPALHQSAIVDTDTLSCSAAAWAL
jgi:hypothetical protein